MVLDKDKKKEQLFTDFFSNLLAPPAENQLQAKDSKEGMPFFFFGFRFVLFIYISLVKKADQRSEARAANQRETESLVKELFSDYTEVAKSAVSF